MEKQRYIENAVCWVLVHDKCIYCGFANVSLPRLKISLEEKHPVSPYF